VSNSLVDYDAALCQLKRALVPVAWARAGAGDAFSDRDRELDVSRGQGWEKGSTNYS